VGKAKRATILKSICIVMVGTAQSAPLPTLRIS